VQFAQRKLIHCLARLLQNFSFSKKKTNQVRMYLRIASSRCRQLGAVPSTTDGKLACVWKDNSDPRSGFQKNERITMQVLMVLEVLHQGRQQGGKRRYSHVMGRRYKVGVAKLYSQLAPCRNASTIAGIEPARTTKVQQKIASLQQKRPSAASNM